MSPDGRLRGMQTLTVGKIALGVFYGNLMFAVVLGVVFGVLAYLGVVR
jgi:hypothetical protein